MQDRGDGVLTNLHRTMDEKFVIEEKSRALDWPTGEGYLTLSPSWAVLKRFGDMSFHGDLVPWYVKLKLKEALKDTLEPPTDFEGEIAVNLTQYY